MISLDLRAKVLRIQEEISLHRSPRIELKAKRCGCDYR